LSYRSYRRRRLQEYDVRRIHLQFRNVWEQGLSKASQIINELKSKGWDVDEDLYFSSQAEREARGLESEGYVVQKQPVIKWGDEEIYLLAYKPSPNPPPQPPAAPKQQKKEPQSPEANFKRIFWRKKEPEEKYMQDGLIISPDRSMAFVSPNATDSLAKDAEEAIKEAGVVAGHGIVEEFDYQTLLKHQKNNMKYVTVTLNNKPYGYNIENVKKAIRVFGLERNKTQHAKAYVSDQSLEGVMIVTDGSGNKVLIAPVNNPPPALCIPLRFRFKS